LRRSFPAGGLRQPAARDDAVDGVGEAQLRLPLLCVGITEIGKYVAGAAGDRLVGRVHRLGNLANYLTLNYDPLPLLCHKRERAFRVLPLVTQ
jgi:hypothetical protein